MSTDIEMEAKAEAARLRMYAKAVERLAKANTEIDIMNASDVAFNASLTIFI